MPQDVLRPLGESGNSTRPVELIDALEGARFKRQAAQSLFINHCTQFGPVGLGRLAPGETRALTSHEQTIIRALVADVP